MALPDVQASPVRHLDTAGNSQFLKLDSVQNLDGRLTLYGWVTGSLELALFVGGKPVDCYKTTSARPDVARHFGLNTTTQLGFTLFAQVSSTQDLCLGWRAGSADPYSLSSPLSFEVQHDLGLQSAQSLPGLWPDLPDQMLSSDWRERLDELAYPPETGPCAMGAIDKVLVCEQTGDWIIYGWVVHNPTAMMLIEMPDGSDHSLDGAYRYYREDVARALGDEAGYRCGEAAFILKLPFAQTTGAIKLKVRVGDELRYLSLLEPTLLTSDPVLAAKHLLAVPSALSGLSRRMQRVENSIIEGLLQADVSRWSQLSVTQRQFGQAQAQTTLSIIIPVYGDLRLVEHQLLEFVMDDWLMANAELIYVIDDGRTAALFEQEVAALHTLYPVAMQWLWGGAHRGFAGACNLGASRARGDYLIFMHHDVIPVSAGWAAELIAPLQQHAELGLVGPQLLSADGTMQHSHLELDWHAAFDLWTVKESERGLPPALNTRISTASIGVPAALLSSACIAMRRSQFDRWGGWDTAYLMGDFTDVDLSMQAHHQASQVVMLPQVVMVHLQRLSHVQPGAGDLRSRIAIYNLSRFKRRWSDLIAQRAAEGHAGFAMPVKPIGKEGE